MSAETKAALDAAIQAHVADEADGELRLLTDYYMVTAAVCEDTSVTCYLHVCSDAGTHVLLGLIEIGKRRMLAHYGDDADL